MLTVWGSPKRFCDGITRRNFLRIGAFGAGLTLAGLLRGRAHAGPRTSNKSAIMIYLPGGPSHMDMYDLKPDAPAEYRGEFKPIATNVAGIRFASTSRFRRRCSTSSPSSAPCSRSARTLRLGSHDRLPEAINQTAHHPSIGAVISKLRGNQRQDIRRTSASAA
jgi:hypothetical protein